MCGDSTGPFLDTKITIPVFGHVYICMSIPGKRPGCVQQMARADDMVEGERYRLAEERIAFLEEEISSSVEDFRKSKVVTLDDMLKFQEIRERGPQPVA